MFYFILDDIVELNKQLSLEDVELGDSTADLEKLLNED